MAALANPLPVIVIAEMLGVSAGDHAKFKNWSNDLISSFGQEMATGPSAAGLAAKDELRRYLAEAIKQRSANPADDLISALVTARDESDALSENELLAFVVLLLLAGNETTTNLIGNGLLALCRNPEQQDRLRENRDLIPKAIEEMLRYDPPVQMTVRMPTAATSVGGTEIPAGSLAFILLAAANRDPAHFPNPEEIRRRTRSQRARVVRRGHPLLPRRAAGAARRRDRDRGDARQISAHSTCQPAGQARVSRLDGAARPQRAAPVRPLILKPRLSSAGNGC